MLVKLAVHQQYVVALVLGSLYVAELGGLVRGVQIYHAVLLVGLLGRYQGLVLIQRIVLALHVLKQEELLGGLVELLVGQHTVLDEHLDVVPLLLELGAVVLEHLVQFLGHLLRDVTGNLLHLRVGLQIASAHVQRDVGRVDHTLHQHHELRHHALHLVCDIDLVAVQLYAVVVHVHVGLDLREVEDTGQVEGVVNVQMDPEHRILLARLQLVVELQIVLVGQFRRLARPQRLGVVHHVVLVSVNILTVLPLLHLTRNHRNREETAILLQQCVDARLLQEFLAIVVNIEDYVRAATLLVGLGQRIFGAAVAGPLHGLGALLIAQRTDHDFLRHHERRIESESEVADDGIGSVLIFL